MGLMRRPLAPHLAVQRAGHRRTIEANLFPAAHAAVEPWDSFHWHAGPGERCDTFKPHSSQALAIDVFGTLKLHPHRDGVLDALAMRLGLPPGGPWRVELEWRDPDNHLREMQPTWVDAMARGAHSLIFFECKFSEPDGGACSQTRAAGRVRAGGRAPCNGHYMPQAHPVTGEIARCALSARGIGYWDVIPTIFDYDAAGTYAPCPFAGPRFQWMRNLATCAAVAAANGLRPAVVVVYADGPGLPMAERVRQPEWTSLAGRLNPAAITFTALSFQSVVELARRADPADPLWAELAAWVQRKIDTVTGR